MATVDVTSWSEFLEAAAVSGDTVNCPEYAEWDLAAIEPGGHTGSITINATINGNGTKIKNLVIEHGVDQYGATFNIGGTTINDLHILNANLVGGGKVLLRPSGDAEGDGAHAGALRGEDAHGGVLEDDEAAGRKAQSGLPDCLRPLFIFDAAEGRAIYFGDADAP